jgi:hypothetical protein
LIIVLTGNYGDYYSENYKKMMVTDLLTHNSELFTNKTDNVVVLFDDFSSYPPVILDGAKEEEEESSYSYNSWNSRDESISEDESSSLSYMEEEEDDDDGIPPKSFSEEPIYISGEEKLVVNTLRNERLCIFNRLRSHNSSGPYWSMETNNNEDK